jgi:hypothetical protein
MQVVTLTGCSRKARGALPRARLTPVDSDEHLRILNGSIHRHLAGWLPRLAGLPPDLLPPAPGWNWRLDAWANIARGKTGYLQASPAIWWIAIAFPLLLSPLPWQRYFLPLLQAALLLAGAGAKALTALVGRLGPAEAVPGPSL